MKNDKFLEATELSLATVMHPWQEVIAKETPYGVWSPTKISTPYRRYKVTTRKSFSFIVFGGKDIFLASSYPSGGFFQGTYRESFVRLVSFTPFPDSPWGDIRSYLADPTPSSIDYLALMALSFKPFELDAVYSYVQDCAKMPLDCPEHVDAIRRRLKKETTIRADASRVMRGDLYPCLEGAQRFLAIRSALCKAVGLADLSTL